MKLPKKLYYRKMDNTVGCVEMEMGTTELRNNAGKVWAHEAHDINGKKYFVEAEETNKYDGHFFIVSDCGACWGVRFYADIKYAKRDCLDILRRDLEKANEKFEEIQGEITKIKNTIKKVNTYGG